MIYFERVDQKNAKKVDPNGRTCMSRNGRISSNYYF